MPSKKKGELERVKIQPLVALGLGRHGLPYGMQRAGLTHLHALLVGNMLEKFVTCDIRC